jgi:hypothetical protein
MQNWALIVGFFMFLRFSTILFVTPLIFHCYRPNNPLLRQVLHISHIKLRIATKLGLAIQCKNANYKILLTSILP